MPACDNYGVPAKITPVKPDKSASRDPHYNLGGNKKALVSVLRCKSCNENPPIKSNAAIVAEIERLTEADGLLRLEETIGCRNEGCDNRGLAIAFHSQRYRKCGQVAGYGQRYQCKGCGSKVVLSHPVRLHDHHRRHAADVFSRIANKSPVRRTVRRRRTGNPQSLLFRS